VRSVAPCGILQKASDSVGSPAWSATRAAPGAPSLGAGSLTSRRRRRWSD